MNTKTIKFDLNKYKLYEKIKQSKEILKVDSCFFNY